MTTREHAIALTAGVDDATYPTLDPIGRLIVEIAWEIASAERQITAALDSIINSAGTALARLSKAQQDGAPSGSIHFDSLGDRPTRYAEDAARLDQMWKTMGQLKAARKTGLAATPVAA